MIKGIDHIGIAVRSIEEVERFYVEGLEIHIEKKTEIPEQGVRVAFMRIAGIKLELIEPISDSSPISKFLMKKGQGLHHICFQVDNIEKQAEKIKRAGFKIVDNASDVGAEGSKVLFIHPSSSGNVLYEFVEE